MFNKRKKDDHEKDPLAEIEDELPIDEDMDSSTDNLLGDNDDSKVNELEVNAGGTKTSANLKPSIISEGFEFIGEIRSTGYLTIDGTVRGTLSLHSIQIGVSGVLDGNVVCDTMNVKGNLTGSLDCRDLTIGSQAIVDGKLSFSSITIQRGGVVKGELKKSDK